MKIILAFVLVCLGASLVQCSYTLKDNFSGSNFLSNFQFWTAADPTHGYVYYASASQAASWGYTSYSNGVNYIRSDDTSVSSGSGRGSVRLTSNNVYNDGLFIFDNAHMPYGCGTWPAMWTVGPNWPAGGEIDVIEGVNQNSLNQMTLHTSSGCTITGAVETGNQLTTDCYGADNGNEGCGVQDPRTNSYGAGFNSNGGGVHAMLWDTTGVKVWFFPRNSIPGDITNGNPNPSGWGTPVASFPSTSCSASHFSNHQIVIDNTFCGDWAGSVYGSSGCPSTCTAFVQNNPGSFTEAYWAINSIKVYTASSSTSSSATSSSSSGASCGTYDTSAYVCDNGNLCPIGAPDWCNGACYNPSSYKCCNNVLSQPNAC